MTAAPALKQTVPAPVLVHSPTSTMARVLESCRRVARSDATVLLTGETGTGKEVLARYVHAHSTRTRGAFVPVNCGAIPESLLESEFFGYEKGAFTGATAARRGRVAAAEGGTLFLDEIGELPISLQVKLLRVLQERSYEPVGSVESRPANFRLIAATNRDLAKEVEAGRFRRDLYFRLFVCPIEAPALRDRTEDIPMLFEHFWSERGETRPVEPGVFSVLARYSWPGNVRELENLVERVSVCTEGPAITAESLPAPFGSPVSVPASAAPACVLAFPVADLRPAPVAAPAPVVPAAPMEDVLPPLATGSMLEALVALLDKHPLPGALPELMSTIENRLIDRALAESGNNKKAAAANLGLQRTTLVEKLRRRQKVLDSSLPAPAEDAATEVAPA